MQLPGGGAFDFEIPQGVIGGQRVRVRVPAPPPPPGKMSFEVTIPEGKNPGDKFPVTLPNGAVFQFEVPAGIKAGEKVRIDAEPAPPGQKGAGAKPAQ